MRLRYLRIQDRAPLRDVEARFGFEPVLRRECAVHFVVGLNGAGKSRLLQSLAHILVSLGNRQLPPFPATLAYDLGAGRQKRTILFDARPGRAPKLVLFEPKVPDDFDRWAELADAELQERQPHALLAQDIIPSSVLDASGIRNGVSPLYLPDQALVYTSGALSAWQDVFRASLDDGARLDQAEDADVLPPGWDIARERRERGNRDAREWQPPWLSEQSRVGELVTPELLHLMYLGVELAARASESSEELSEPADDAPAPPQSSWRRIREAVENPVSVSLALRFDQARALENADPTLRQLRASQGVAVIERAEPGTDAPAWTELIFDLDRVIEDREGDNRAVAALVEAMAGRPDAGRYSAYGVYQQLSDWWRAGMLTQAALAVAKRGNGEKGDLMLFDALSDGERSFLSRMALMHLLADQDDVLLILDEPETHFNDVWKRQIVDILDDNMRERSNEVLISTNSSIGLSDVFREEVLLLAKRDDATAIFGVNTPTFGADPSEVMVAILGAPDSIGKRAQEYLEKLLREDWTPERRAELERWIRGTGAGYFRSELRSIWRRLNAAQDQPAR